MASLEMTAPVFAALGDATRASLAQRLAAGTAMSISRLAEGASMSRQAITKHLRVLERAGVVRSERKGRETVYALDRSGVAEAQRALAEISRHWDEALDRLRSHVEG